MEPAFLRVPRGPPPLCSELIRHAAQGNTILYFSLLPPELCAEIDALARSVSWLLGGVMRHLGLPHGLTSVFRVLSADDEEVIVGNMAKSRDDQVCRLLCACMPAFHLQRFITRSLTSSVSRAPRRTHGTTSRLRVGWWLYAVRISSRLPDIATTS